jgi:hypothetical protein
MAKFLNSLSEICIIFVLLGSWGWGELVRFSWFFVAFKVGKIDVKRNEK